MSASSARIRTPDQRLRVFVSSTLKELAPERAAARAAIEGLAMAPVMFELGARPHPPRDLYRAYLAQSDVFLGIYGDSYGWVAPGEAVSGLEDEYLLAPPGVPKLVYIRRPHERQERLDELLGRIRDDDHASYKAFATAEELGPLVTADLATLLAERFDESRVRPPAVPPPSVEPRPAMTPPPAPLTGVVGREAEVAGVVALLVEEGARLVTLTGPGGIGKTRLAIEVADRVRDAFPGGIAFVDLAPVREAAQVVPAIAQALGVRDAGDGALQDKVVVALRDRRALLLLDNLEQVVDAAGAIQDLLVAAPDVTALATSRILLRVTGERAFPVGPLALPGAADRTDPAAVLANPSVALLVERARSAKPDFELTAANAGVVADICAALDGVPLAIEIAAARLRMLPPQALYDRLCRGLPLLTGGARDLPARQRTLRAAIEWSTRLLSAPEQQLLARLGVFQGTFELDAVEWMAEEVEADPLDALGALVDGSLVHQEDRGDRAVFSMLSTVREYALEELAAQDGLAAARYRHARFYLRLAADAEDALEGGDQSAWVARLGDDRENLRAALRFLLDERRWTEAADLAWRLYVYWWVGGQLGPLRALMQEPLDSGDDLQPHTRAIALYFTHAIAFWQDPEHVLVPGFRESAALFARTGDRPGEALALISLALALLAQQRPEAVGDADAALERGLGLFRAAHDAWGESFALVTLGRIDLLMRRFDEALARFDAGLAAASRQHDRLGESIGWNHLGWARLALGRTAEAATAFAEGLRRSAALGHDEGVAYGLEGMVAVEAVRGDAEAAARLLGASEVLRERKGLYQAASFSFHQPAVDALLAGPSGAAFGDAVAAGRRIDQDAAVRAALDIGEQPDVPAGAGRA